MCKAFIEGFLALVLVLNSSASFAGSCQGQVMGLSKTYDKANGSGFLAVRKKPTATSRQIGELFNMDVVEVNRRNGNWIYVTNYDNLSGWVFQKYVTRECDGI